MIRDRRSAPGGVFAAVGGSIGVIELPPNDGDARLSSDISITNPHFMIVAVGGNRTP